MSGIDISNWFALKKYDADDRPYMQMYAELSEKSASSELCSANLLRAHLGIYFNHFDNDYDDLKHMLGIEPLALTLLPTGTINKFEEVFGRPIRTINASRQDEIEILRLREHLPRRSTHEYYARLILYRSAYISTL